MRFSLPGKIDGSLIIVPPLSRSPWAAMAYQLHAGVHRNARDHSAGWRDHAHVSSPGNNGHRALVEALANSEWKTVEQALASLTVFASPITLEETNYRPVFRIIRGSTQRGNIDYENRVMFDIDGNHGPIFAFCWATGFFGAKNYLQFNHIYGGRTESKNVEFFTNLANICVTPTFLAKFTDKHFATLLQFRAWDLFGFRSPQGAIPPKPDAYDRLEWASPLDPLSDVEGRMRDIMSTKPSDSATRSVRELGWVFSSFEPDLTIDRQRSGAPARIYEPVDHAGQEGENDVMGDNKLEESLGAIGKACFIKHYELFRDKSRTDTLYVIDFLVRNEKYKEDGAKIRVGFARRIFDAGRQNDALKIIALSRRIPQESVDKAKILLKEELFST